MDHENSKYMGKVDRKNGRSGYVEVDEIYVGDTRPGKRVGGASGKTIVLDMAERDSDLTTVVVPYMKMNVDIVDG